MKSILLLLIFLEIGGITASAQPDGHWVTEPLEENGKWIKEPGYNLHTWNSFMVFEDITTPANLSGRSIKGLVKQPGKIVTSNVTISEGQALAIIHRLIGKSGISQYGISKDIPNIVRYENGLILYGYQKENDLWELFNIEVTSMIIQMPYQEFGLAKAN